MYFLLNNIFHKEKNLFIRITAHVMRGISIPSLEKYLISLIYRCPIHGIGIVISNDNIIATVKMKQTRFAEIFYLLI